MLGDRDLSMNDVTRTIGEKIGNRDLQYVRFSYDDLSKVPIDSGWSCSVSGAFVHMIRVFNDGAVKPLQGRGSGNSTSTRFEDFTDKLSALY